MANSSIRNVKKSVSTMASSSIRKFKDSTSKQKKYLGIALFLFLLQFFMGGDTFYQYTDTNYLLIFSIIGLLTALNRRARYIKSINEKSIINIIYNDYSFSSFASLSLLSLFYAILQGIFLGTGFGFIFYAIGSLFYGSINLFGINIGGFFICLVLTTLTRIFIEFISLILRLAEDISKIVNK